MIIGTATIEYDQNGKAVWSEFIPDMPLRSTESLSKQLATVKQGDEEAIKANASLIMAAWFNQVTEIELADREEFKISEKIVDCVKFDTGEIKKCSIQFSLDRI